MTNKFNKLEDPDGNLYEIETDENLEQSGVPADAAATGKAFKECLLKNQGVENVGKILVVGTDGNLVLTDMPEGGTTGDVTGVLDDSNNILLTGNLADGTYTLKWRNDDGTYSDAGTIEVGEIVAEPTNLFVVGGDGFILNGRCSSTGEDRTDSNGGVVSNYITVANGNTVYVKNVDLTPAATSTYCGMKLTDGSTIGFIINGSDYITNYSVSNGVTQFTINKADIVAIRLYMQISYGTALTTTDVESKGIIITVNEPLS